MTESNKGLEAGRAMRRKVLGGELVDQGAKAAWPFAQPYMDFITEHVWGAVWTRPGLSPRDRSLLNLGMLAAMGRGQELGIHLNGALNNGLTAEEIREIFIQVGAYCGAPLGQEAFRVARKVFEERGLTPEKKP